MIVPIAIYMLRNVPTTALSMVALAAKEEKGSRERMK
jgi:hypothetical protein